MRSDDLEIRPEVRRGQALMQRIDLRGERLRGSEIKAVCASAHFGGSLDSPLEGWREVDSNSCFLTIIEHGHGPLFRHVRPDRDGRRSTYIARKIDEWMDDVIKDPNLAPNHSFRHYLKSALLDRDGPSAKQETFERSQICSGAK